MNKLTFFFLLATQMLVAQSVIVEGYVYESGNRGYISEVSVDVFNEDGVIIKKLLTNREGFFQFQSESGKKLTIEFSKALYNDYKVIQTMPSNKEKHFVNVEMKRAPGYLFEVTIAEERSKEGEAVDAVKGYRIDVFNNIKDKEEFVWDNYIEPVFSVPLFKENHYTILIRKDGYMSKRIEAFVDIEGCILCFEGLGSVGPGVSETLSEGNQIGVLLANVSLTKAYAGKKMQVKDIYYDLGKWSLKPKSKKELNKLATLMKDNPRWIVELGSHTDSRGKDESNLTLSNKRAQSAVDYLVYEKNIDRNRISARGYGESILINDCDDNIKCSEAQHLLNRRTEIKIVGMSDKMRYQSLAEIKRSENMEDILKEIQFGEQVMIPVYDAYQDSILNAKKDSIATSLKIQDSLAMEREKVIHQVIDSTQVVSQDSVNLDVDEKEEPVNMPNNIDVSQARFEKTVTKVKVVKDNTATHSNDVDSNTQEPSTKSLSDMIVKIVAYQNEEMLSKDDSLYSTYENVKEIFHNGMFKYMIGEFESKEEAMLYLKKYIADDYPDAYIVKMKR